MSKKHRIISQRTQAIRAFPYAFSQEQTPAAVLGLQQRLIDDLQRLATAQPIPDYIKLLRHVSFAKDVKLVKAFDEALALKIEAINQAAQKQIRWIDARKVIDNNNSEQLALFEEPDFSNLTTIKAVQEMEDQYRARLDAIIKNVQIVSAHALLDADDELLQQEQESYEAYLNLICASAQRHKEQLNKNAQLAIQDTIAKINQTPSQFLGLYTHEVINRYCQEQLARLNRLSINKALLVAYQTLGVDEPATIQAQALVSQVLHEQKSFIFHLTQTLRRTGRNGIRQTYASYRCSIDALEQKIVDMYCDSNKYHHAILAATQVHKALLAAEDKFLISPKPKSLRLQQFKADCAVIFNENNPNLIELAKHRDGKQLIANIVAWIFSVLTLGAFVPVATKFGLFARTTDSIQRVSTLKDSIEGIAIPSAN